MRKLYEYIKEELDNLLLESVERLQYKRVNTSLNKIDENTYQITDEYIITVNDESTLDMKLNLLKRGDKTTLEGSFEKEGSYESTNDNKPYQVFATVFGILKDFVDEYQQKYNDEIDKMIFIPFKEEGETDNRRRLIYTRYLRNIFPNYDIKDKVIGIVLTKK